MQLVRILMLVMVVAMLTACGAQQAPKPVNPMGLSGKVTPEAEKYYALARVLWGKNDACSDPQQAVIYLDKAIAAQPDYAEAYLRRGLALSDLGRYDEAFDDLTKSIRLAPTPSAYAYRGLVSLRMGNLLGARKDVDHALELDPKLARAWNTRAGVKLQLDDIAGACSDFEKGCSSGDCTGLESARKDELCK